MKFITIHLVLLLTIILPIMSSGELTKAKAEKIIRDCEEKAGKPSIKTGYISYGRVEVVSYMNTRHDSNMDKYIEYRNRGLVTIDTLPTITKGSWGRKIEAFQIHLTPKASEHIISRDTLDDVITAKFKICQYLFDSVTEVHIIPDKNIASVKAKLIRTNETPFFTEVSESNNKKEVIRKLTFRKTTDGWKLCD